MIKKSTLFKTLVMAGSLALFSSTTNAQYFSEEFEDITTLPTSGWEEINASNPIGSTGYFQGNTTVFAQYTGAGYLGVNYNSTAGTGTISNWMLSPTVTLNNNDVITFYTMTVPASTYPDRLQVRYSLAGSSNNVGANEFDTGDFTELALDINPTYATATYPEVWTRYDIIIVGLSGPTSGRFAFRYFVEDAGPTGNNSNYIGIDSCAYYAGVAGFNDLNNNMNVSVYPNPSVDFINLNFNKALTENVTVKVFDAMGKMVINYSVATGTRINQLDVRSLANGVYTLDITGDNHRLRKQISKQ